MWRVRRKLPSQGRCKGIDLLADTVTFIPCLLKHQDYSTAIVTALPGAAERRLSLVQPCIIDDLKSHYLVWFEPLEQFLYIDHATNQCKSMKLVWVWHARRKLSIPLAQGHWFARAWICKGIDLQADTPCAWCWLKESGVVSSEWRAD